MPLNERAYMSLPSVVPALAVAALSLAALLVCSAAQAAEPKLVVTTEPKSQPESFTVTPDGSLIIGSASKPVIYRPHSPNPKKKPARTILRIAHRPCIYAPLVFQTRALECSRLGRPLESLLRSYPLFGQRIPEF